MIAGQGDESLDPIIHERMRLAMLSALAVNERLSFRELKALLGATDGNLQVHGTKLEASGYVRSKKSARRTDYALTAKGRRALNRYVDHMEALIDAIRKR